MPAATAASTVDEQTKFQQSQAQAPTTLEGSLAALRGFNTAAKTKATCRFRSSKRQTN
jgi:hypothetical protein